MVIHTIWHENLTAIKFYGLSKLLREIKLMDFNFTEAHVIEVSFTSARIRVQKWLRFQTIASAKLSTALFHRLASGRLCRVVFRGTRNVFSCVLPYCSPFYRAPVYRSIVLLATCRGHNSSVLLWLSKNPLATSSLRIDKERTLVGSDTDKLEGELEEEPLFLALYENYFTKTSRC